MKLATATSSLLLPLAHGGGHLIHLSDAAPVLRGSATSSEEAKIIISDGSTLPAADYHDHNHRMLPKGGNKPNNNFGTCKITNEKVGIYIGGGVCTSCVQWATALAAFWETGMRGPLGSGHTRPQS